MRGDDVLGDDGNGQSNNGNGRSDNAYGARPHAQAMDAVITAMEQHASEEPVQEQCCWVLTGLSLVVCRSYKL